MALDLQAAHVVNALAGTLLMGLAVVLFRVDPDARLSRALALVLLVRGATNLLGILGFLTGPNIVERFFLVAMAMAMAWFLVVIVAEGLGRRIPPVLAVVLGLVALSGIWLVLEGSFLLGAAFHVKLATYALAAGLLVWLALRRVRRHDITGLTWAATGFLLNPLTYAVGGAIRFPFWPVQRWEPSITSELVRTIQWGVNYGVLVVAILVVLALQRAAMMRGDRRLQRAVLVQMAFVGGTIALVLGPVVSLDGSFDPAWVDIADAITTVAFGLLVTYAVLRHRIVETDIRVKEAIPIVAVAAALLLSYAGIEAFVAARLPTEQATMARITGVVLLIAAVLWFRGAGARLADLAMPGVHRDGAYLEARRIEIYRDALREANAVRTPEDLSGDPVLRRLRRSLGISDREHALLVLALQPSDQDALGMVPERTVLGGQYRVLSPLGRGGQGVAFLAQDEVLGRLVVLKVMHAEHDPGEEDAMLREARAFAAVDHPNVVTVHDVQRVGGQTILVMEHVAGGSLKDALATGPLDAESVDRLVQDLLAALGAVHEAGLVHRDVKPSNLLRHLDGRWKLADFGLARQETDEQTIAGLGAHAPPAGTAAYMSPEQARGERPTPVTDLHAAGLTIAAALRGTPVHVRAPNENDGDLVRRITRARGTLTPADTPAHLVSWFDEVLVVDPSQRTATAAEMRAAWPGTAPPETPP